MEIQSEKVGDVVIAHVLIDELDAGNVPEFKRDVAPALEESTRLVLDLSRLRFLDSSGLGAFLSCLRRLNAKGGTLKLGGIGKEVQTVCELVRLNRIMGIHGTVEEAVRAFATLEPQRR